MKKDSRRLTIGLGVVTIPNRINFFKDLLHSIFIGSQFPDEIIIVINGAESSNGGEVSNYIQTLNNIIKNHEKKPVIKLVCLTKNVPVGFCRTLLVKASQCDYIAMVDDDVILDSLWMEKISQSLQFNPDILAGRVELSPNSPCNITEYVKKRPYFNEFISVMNYIFIKRRHEISKDIFLVDGIRGVWGNNMIIKRKLIDRIGSFNILLGYFEDNIGVEDTEFKIRARKSGARFLYNSSAVVYHRINPKRLTLSYALKRAWHHGLAYSYIFLLRYLVKACVYEFLSIFYYFLKDRKKEFFLAITRFISVISAILSMRKRKDFLSKRISAIQKAKYTIITL
jgi:GT2 family glycosyltransferase